MSRYISQSFLRSSLRLSNTCIHSYRAPRTGRLLSTAPPVKKSRSWKSSTVRWGLAAGAIYYYNTSPLFADNPTLLEPLLPDSPTEDTTFPTLESVARSRTSIATPSVPPVSPPQPPPPIPDESSPSPLSDPSGTESEAASEGAFNEETGEINWDCPCLGGMAHGPCGEQFRTAFSCFVYSKEEPKGMNCIEHFKGMQECFREYPDIYGGEAEDDEVEKEALAQETSIGEEAEGSVMPVHQVQAEPTASPTTPAPRHRSAEGAQVQDLEPAKQAKGAQTQRTQEATAQVQKDHSPLDESDELVPKAAHDATIANEGK
ncbi:MAG: hypothetical protein Q9182_004858 [Xanthomendoza sp. 2 TL-2023]